MTAHARLRVVVYNHVSGQSPILTSESLSGQSTAPERFETFLAAGPNLAQSLNRAAAVADAETLAFVPSGSRLHPRFLARCVEALNADPRTQAVFTGHTGGDAAGLPFAAIGGFRTMQLLRRNAVGPAFAVRRSAWDALGGLRPDLRLALWDFWLRLALRTDLHEGSPYSIHRLPELLASCPPQPRLAPQEEGRAKALLVVRTPGIFEPDVCRWALALLRGEAWATPFDPGRIPGPVEVRGMWAEGRETAMASRPLRRSA